MKKVWLLSAILLVLISLVGCEIVPAETDTSESVKTQTETESVTETENETESTVSYLFYDQKTDTKYTNAEVFKNTFLPDAENNMLVIHISFKGEPALDKEKFEDLFIREYDEANCMRSVKSYFHYNSGGRDLLNFTFVYYDCDMTVEEAWHYVNDEDQDGSFYANQFLYDVFDELCQRGDIDTRSLDANSDGYVDATAFLVGDRPSVDDCYIYGAAQGRTDKFEYMPDVNEPVLGQFIKLSMDMVRKDLINGSYQHENIRVLLHEIGHLFGLTDYYDMYPLGDDLISPLGDFDMQSCDIGDWNIFSKFTCGWASPYVITDDIDTATIKLRSSSSYNEAILIPSCEGWNGTAFDEYILVEVLAPDAANGFDWEVLTSTAERNDGVIENENGGVRILHVDARLLRSEGSEFMAIDDLEELIGTDARLSYRFTNSNGYEPIISSDSNYYHIVDWIPKDGTSKLRICTSSYWSLYCNVSSNDLFTAGDVFSMATHKDAFVNGEMMNNGAAFDYEIKVESYDADLHEAIVTISKIY